MFKSRIVLILVSISSILLAEENKKANLKKPSIESTKYFDINRITNSVHNNGIFGRHPISGNADFYLDDSEVIYTAGLWIAANVNSEIRASAADYNTDFVGSAIDTQGDPYGKNDSTFRAYKISRGDNASNNQDYAEWPIQIGAPSNVNGNPLLIGDQTLWCCYTDSYAEDRKFNICSPLGAEVHLTTWGWEKIDNVIFLRWKIHNKSEQRWNDVYFGIFVDPDMGDARDELTGCDSTLNLLYDYESSRDEFIKTNHAVGCVLLESPIIPSLGDTAYTYYGQKTDYKNVPVSVPKIRKSTVDGWRSPKYRDEKTAEMIHNRLRCLDNNGNPAMDPISGLPSKWAYSGDPILGQGWLDESAMDRYMMISVGPLYIDAGDTNSFTMAIIANRRHNRLTCVYDLKKQAQAIQSFFRKSAGIYTEMVHAQEGQTGICFPIRLMNKQEVQNS